MNSNRMLTELIRARFRNTLDMFELTRAIDHTVEKGGFREFFISELIKPLIPPHFGIGNGIIMDITGLQSPQIDILIYDKRNLQPIFQTESRGIYPIDSVIMVIEIKSKLTTTDLKNLSKTSCMFLPGHSTNSFLIATPGKIEDVKNSKGKMTQYPGYSIFAYDSDANKDEGIRIKEQCESTTWAGFRLIGVANKGIWGYEESTNDFNKINCTEDDIIIVYLKHLLSNIEETALTRGNFGLQYWL